MTSKKSTTSHLYSGEKLAPGLRLTPEEVATNQRERLFAALIDLLADRGYQATSVSDIIARAAVSRSSFYALFENRRDCVLQAYDGQIARLSARVLSAYNTPGLSPSDALKAAVGAALEFAAAWPASAQLCISEVIAIGEHGIEHHNRSLARGQEALLTALRRIGAPRADPILAHAILAGIGAAVHGRVQQRATHLLRSDLERLQAWLLSYERRPPRTRPRAPSARDSSTATPADRPAAGGRTEQQRERIVAAIIELTASKSFQTVSYRDIASAAEVSLTTFYRHFDGKPDAFLAAFDVCGAELLAVIENAARRAPADPRRLAAIIANIIGYLRSNPGAARILLPEVLGMGRRGEMNADQLLVRCSASVASSIPALRAVCRANEPMTSAAVREILCQHIVLGELTDLHTLIAPLTFVALAPIVGAEQAWQLARDSRL